MLHTVFLVNTLILQVNRGSSLVASQGRGTSAPLYGISPPARAPHLETWLYSQQVRDRESMVPPRKSSAHRSIPKLSSLPTEKHSSLA